MMEPDGPLGERVAIVETDIKHIVSGIARIEGGIARIENDVVPRTREELNGRLSETKAEFKADIGGLRTELKAGIGDLRTELKSDIGDLRTELKSDIGNLRTELKEDFQRGIDILETAMTHNKTALYAVCGTVITGVAAALVKGSFF